MFHIILSVIYFAINIFCFSVIHFFCCNDFCYLLFLIEEKKKVK